MKTIVQRVTRGQVVVDGKEVGAIDRGAVLLLGVEAGDTLADATATAEKIAKMRFFPGATPMDRTLADVEGACLVISQFTLAANLRKGNRPSFGRAMDPEPADALYRAVVDRLGELGVETATGEFGASMQVELVNDGPVTFLVESVGGKIQ
jgi:D-tyrosyl-tRNA(Tyr) deacylase